MAVSRDHNISKFYLPPTEWPGGTAAQKRGSLQLQACITFSDADAQYFSLVECAQQARNVTSVEGRRSFEPDNRF
jgi:hypothetical protein